jgi:hypothetical protein
VSLRLFIRGNKTQGKISFVEACESKDVNPRAQSCGSRETVVKEGKPDPPMMRPAESKLWDKSVITLL